MQVSNLFTDDEAVSSVIGIILMVAITVILAAVIATFALDLGNKTSEVGPEVSFEFDYSEDGDTNGLDDLNITHDGGDTVRVDRLKIDSDVEFQSTSNDDGTGDPPVDATTTAKFSDFTDQFASADSELKSGDEVSIEADQPDPNFDVATIQIIWESQEGDSTATLAKFNGPNA